MVDKKSQGNQIISILDFLEERLQDCFKEFRRIRREIKKFPENSQGRRKLEQQFDEAVIERNKILKQVDRIKNVSD